MPKLTEDQKMQLEFFWWVIKKNWLAILVFIWVVWGVTDTLLGIG